jgi:hypothetical protein
MLADQALINKPKYGRGEEPSNKQRRAFMGGAVAALLASSRRVMADTEGAPRDPFIVLLHGIYQPVPIGQGPANNLGLTTVNLSDGSFSKTQIYPVYGVDGANDPKKAIGTFYPQATLAQGQITFHGLLCAYDLPGGSILMQFLLPGPAGAPPGFDGFVPVSDGMNGYHLEGTFELKIVEATGIYKPFAGGHNHMVDKTPSTGRRQLR